MDAKKPWMSPGTRLDTGKAILAAAQVVADVRFVKARLTAFTAAQHHYAAAQRKVEAVEARQQAALACDAAQDDAVEALARALVAAGQPRRNPFAAFGMPAPSAIKKIPFADEAQAIHALVAAVQRNKTVGKATLQAAQAAEDASQKLEAVLPSMDKLEVTLQHTRRTRDGIGHTWDTALAALKRGARAAADDGAPNLYAALFGRLSRPNKRTRPASTPAPPAPPVANAA